MVTFFPFLVTFFPFLVTFFPFWLLFSRSGYIRKAEAWVISKRSDSLKKTKMVRLLVYIYSLNSLGEKKLVFIGV